MELMRCIELGQAHKSRLLKLAEQTIEHGLQFQQPLAVDLDTVEPVLRQPAATFVTLYHQQQLAGCIGSLQAIQNLLEDVLHNAYSAAFMDRRFDPLEHYKLSGLDIEIAVLSELSPVEVASEQALMALLMPDVHGLVLEHEGRRATFLPKVWKQLPAKMEFLACLKEKVGLPPDFWSQQAQFSTYTADSFSNFLSCSPVVSVQTYFTGNTKWLVTLLLYALFHLRLPYRAVLRPCR